MNSYLYLFGIILIGFVVYYFIRDKIFNEDEFAMQLPTKQMESFQVPALASAPAPSSIEVRQAPIYPQRTVASSGPNSPNQQPPTTAVIYGDPEPKDPYNESQENSDIPENLRHPERSYRPPPLNNNVDIAVQSGIASTHHQVSNANTQQYEQEFIQGGGEFMPGIFANDKFDDVSYSTF